MVNFVTCSELSLILYLHLPLLLKTNIFLKDIRGIDLINQNLDLALKWIKRLRIKPLKRNPFREMLVQNLLFAGIVVN